MLTNLELTLHGTIINLIPLSLSSSTASLLLLLAVGVLVALSNDITFCSSFLNFGIRKHIVLVFFVSVERKLDMKDVSQYNSQVTIGSSFLSQSLPIIIPRSDWEGIVQSSDDDNITKDVASFSKCMGIVNWRFDSFPRNLLNSSKYHGDRLTCLGGLVLPFYEMCVALSLELCLCKVNNVQCSHVLSLVCFYDVKIAMAKVSVRVLIGRQTDDFDSSRR